MQSNTSGKQQNRGSHLLNSTSGFATSSEKGLKKMNKVLWAGIGRQLTRVCGKPNTILVGAIGMELESKKTSKRQ